MLIAFGEMVLNSQKCYEVSKAMGYYGRRSYRRRKRGYSHRPSPQKSAPSSTYGKSMEFVRQEFFHLETERFERFANCYAQKFGDGAKQYLRRTFPRWKSGMTEMASGTEQRILEFVPPFLDTEKQFKLLSFQIPSVIQQQRSEIRTAFVRASSLKNTYLSLALNLVKRDYQLDWFVKDIFSADEVAEFIEVFKYTMADCLRQSFLMVRKDLTLLQEVLPRIDSSVEINYHIGLLQCPLELDKFPSPEEMLLEIELPTAQLATRFHEQYKRILLNHALAHCQTEIADQANRQIALYDIQTVIGQLQRTNSSQEYESTIEVKGLGGTLRIILQKKNLNRIQFAVARQILFLIFAICSTGLIGAWLYFSNLAGVLFLFGIISFGIIGGICSRLQELRSEINEYERKRTTRPTAS
jgi:hypothetical protein